VLTGNCQSVVNATLDVQRYLPSSVYAANYGNFEDPEEIDLYDEMLRETDPAKQRALIRDLEKYVLDTEAHEIFLLWYYRMVPHRSYVKGWKISPSHYLNLLFAAAARQPRNPSALGTIIALVGTAVAPGVRAETGQVEQRTDSPALPRR
jgi:hypothetical protein